MITSAQRRLAQQEFEAHVIEIFNERWRKRMLRWGTNKRGLLFGSVWIDEIAEWPEPNPQDRLEKLKRDAENFKV